MLDEESCLADISPQTLYASLGLLDEHGIDIDVSALVRQLAQDVLANTSISLQWRQAIADRLHQANQHLQLKTLEDCDSY